MVEEVSGNALTLALVKVASDPSQVRKLHEILGGFCHQCRNTLNSLKLSLYLARRDAAPAMREILLGLEPRYTAVERLYDRLQSVCRPMSLAPIKASLSLLIEERQDAWVESMAAFERRLTLVPPEEPAVGDFDPIRLGEALDSFISWRAEYGPAGQPAELRWRAGEGRFQLHWEEPTGWGPDPSEGFVDQADPLALPLLARVVSTHGGTLDLDLRDGMRLIASWPLDVRLS